MVGLQERSNAWRRAADIKSRLQVSSVINITALGISKEVVHLLKSTFPNTCWYNVGVTYERLIWCRIVYAWCQKYRVDQIVPQTPNSNATISFVCDTAAGILFTEIKSLPCILGGDRLLCFAQSVSYSALLTNTIGIFPHKYKQPIVVKGLPARIRSAETKLVKQLGGGSLDLFELMIVDL